MNYTNYARCSVIIPLQDFAFRLLFIMPILGFISYDTLNNFSWHIIVWIFAYDDTDLFCSGLLCVHYYRLL